MSVLRLQGERTWVLPTGQEEVQADEDGADVLPGRRVLAFWRIKSVASTSTPSLALGFDHAPRILDPPEVGRYCDTSVTLAWVGTVSEPATTMCDVSGNLGGRLRWRLKNTGANDATVVSDIYLVCR